MRAGSWSSQAEPAHFLYCIIPQAVCSLCKQAFPPRAARPGRGCAPGLAAQARAYSAASPRAPVRTAPRAPAPPPAARPASCSATPGEEPPDPKRLPAAAAPPHGGRGCNSARNPGTPSRMRWGVDPRLQSNRGSLFSPRGHCAGDCAGHCSRIGPCTVGLGGEARSGEAAELAVF